MHFVILFEELDLLQEQFHIMQKNKILDLTVVDLTDGFNLGFNAVNSG
jgi:hypothetical protein